MKMSIPNLSDFHREMELVLNRNRYRRMVRDEKLETGILLNFRKYMAGEEKTKSLVDIANYAGMLWNAKTGDENVKADR